jgi:hypothetical protein
MFEVKVKGKIIKVIDGASASTTSAARYANTVLEFDDPNRNSEFVQYNSRIYLKASKKIKRNQEIMTYYGDKTSGVINAK